MNNQAKVYKKISFNFKVEIYCPFFKLKQLLFQA